MSWSREHRSLVEHAEALGFSVEQTQKGHLKLVKNGSPPIFLPSKLPTERHRQNALAQIRRTMRTSGP